MKQPDIMRDVLGIEFAPERIEPNLQTYKDVLTEIAKLRTLDLSHLQPAVIFEPVPKTKKA